MENKELLAKFFAGERERLQHEILADKATKTKKKGRTKNATRLAYSLHYVNEKLMEAQRVETPVEVPKVV